MSDLQLVLLAVGAVAILLVVAYNWWEQQRYKKKAQAAFAHYQQDVLLEPGLTPMDEDTRIAGEDDLPDEEALYNARGQVDARHAPRPVEPPVPERVSGERREPVMGGSRNETPPPGTFSSPIPQPQKTAREALTYPGQQDDRVDLLVDILSHQALDVDLIRAMHRQLNRIGKRVSWQALMSNGEWFPLDVDANLAIMGLRIGLQLADRRGPLDEPSLRQFVATLETFADESESELRLPPLSQALADAQKLDSFCADVDVTIGLNILADSAPFGLVQLRSWLERNGLRLMADGAYHLVNPQGQHLFSIANFDNAPFPPHPLPKDHTEGITLLFDVPRVADGLNVFAQMSDLAFELSGQLNGKLVDDNRKPLSDHGIASIRQQLRAIYGTMNLKGIEPGSQTALRLFA
ncbi:cell division protein ZipA C-terminal FtsZ-binding domain-containing protein [Leeia aquatica]|uniref:Cell division protein ZipA n=1 Tax=Leeia aquatica TaxID=2725557 RepID=A0A847S479_9NEIS|nr:cell division protein ZipA C-terminal FtsZ-binding domain-containing protein [Leeia aquatica]NLR74603.1 hypothetical protein [Leeia aquatica]